jgi:predicted dehydrogenase
MSAENHVPVLLAVPDVQVTWIADREAERAQRVGKAFGVPWVGIDAAAGLPEADVVLLAIPYGARAAFYPELARRGAAVFAEKPLARSLSEHDAICQAFSAARIGCGFQRRSAASSQLLKGLIADNAFGPLRSVRVEFGGPGTRSGGYQADLRMAGGGPLFDVAIHAVDLALFCSGGSAPIVDSTAMLRDGDFDLDTRATISLDVAGSRIPLDLHVSSLRFTRQGNWYSFDGAEVMHDVWGSGVLNVRTSSGHTFVIAGEQASYPATAAQTLHRHWSRFLDGVRSDSPNYTSATDSRTTTEVVAQLYGWAG